VAEQPLTGQGAETHPHVAPEGLEAVKGKPVVHNTFRFDTWPSMVKSLFSIVCGMIS
jgi:hypothetical protein